MADRTPPTAKGARQVEAILDAAIVCLGRDGYAASSVQRIADEAGVLKRSVLYYFGTGDALLERVVERISARLIEQVAAAVQDLDEPAAIVTAGFDQVWGNITHDRALLAAYYGLAAEAATDPDLARRVRHLTDAYRGLLAIIMRDVEAGGRVLRLDPDVIAEIAIAGIQGLQLSWLERGDTPALAGAISEFQRWLSSLAPLPDSDGRS